MTDNELRLAIAMQPGRVLYLPFSFEQRFARDLTVLATRYRHAHIPPMHLATMLRIAQRFHLQLSPETNALVETMRAALEPQPQLA